MAKRKKKSRRTSERNGKGTPKGRPFWSGTITFGLVSVPVHIFPATRSSQARLRIVDQSGQPLRRRYYCPEDDQDVPPEHIVRGYEISEGEYVTVTDTELEELEPKKSREIDLRRFIDLTEMHPAYFQRPYFLTPAGESTKAYRLLAEVMEQTDRAGIATFVMRGKEYLVAILAENGILRAETLRFAGEIRPPEEAGLAEPEGANRQQITRFKQAIQRLTRSELDVQELVDPSVEQLAALAERKRRRKEDLVEVAHHEPDVDELDEEGSIELIDTIRAHLNPDKAKAAG